MAEFITYVEPSSYEIDFKTMDYSEYREIEEAARVILDRHIDTHNSDRVSMDKYHNKTYAMDFFEKFPNAPKDKDGKPETCIKKIYSDVVVSCSCMAQSCAKCWDQEMKENA